MNSEKIMILKLDSKSVFMKYISSEVIENIYVIRISSFGFFMKLLRKIKLDFCIYGSWKKRLKQIDNIIIFDNGYNCSITKYIKKKNPECKIIFYYWNIINSHNNLALYDSNIDEVWTFDKADAKRYDLKYNPQFYSKKVILEEKNIENDILFLGRDKNRKKTILELEKICLSKKIKTNFIVVKNERNLLSYQEYLDLLGNSRCILDILSKNQKGMTIRVMEALFLNKKLITNNQDIVNYDFYCKENIFVLGKDNLDDLEKFIKSNYKKIPDDIINNYNYESWLKRFYRK